jgi:hypothetical protein
MKRASADELRQGLKSAQVFAKAGVDFVCIPIISQANKIDLRNQAETAIEKLIELAEAVEENENK